MLALEKHASPVPNGAALGFVDTAHHKINDVAEDTYVLVGRGGVYLATQHRYLGA